MVGFGWVGGWVGKEESMCAQRGSFGFRLVCFTSVFNICLSPFLPLVVGGRVGGGLLCCVVCVP